MDIIIITNPNQLPHGVSFYIYSEEEFLKFNPPPELSYKIVRQEPKPGYVEYLVPTKD